MATELEKIADKERTISLSRNEYNYDDLYNSTNPNALSTGDDKGKGELDGKIGGITDINTRIDNTGRNIYNPNLEYNSTNLNALSNGDEKGKGELDGSVGGLTDINIRIDNTGRNKFGEKKTYPDF